MIHIININPNYGDPVQFSGETLEDAICAMETALRACGGEFADVVVNHHDYDVVDEV